MNIKIDDILYLYRSLILPKKKLLYSCLSIFLANGLMADMPYEGDRVVLTLWSMSPFRWLGELDPVI